jgi:GT2 family glycosyltransferase
MPEALSRRRGAARRDTTAEPAFRQAAMLASDVAILVRDGSVEVGKVSDADDADEVLLELSSGRHLEMGRERWQEVLKELKELVREELAPLDAEARAAVLEALTAASALESDFPREVSGSLNRIREVLRERLPRCDVSESQPAGLAVEKILAIDDASFWLNGWLHDRDDRGEVRIVSPEGATVCVTADAFRYERPDVIQFYASQGVERGRDHGFTALATLPAPSLLSAGWLAELRTSDGLQLEIACPALTRDPSEVRASILGELGARGRICGPLAVHHGRPALTRLQERIVAASEVEQVDSYGEPPARPKVSIVVPLYKRLDFIEHQLLAFSHDPELAEAELVYVLDSVEQREELERQARELFALYGLPFRVVNLSAGAGFAGANEHGIGVAAAKRLLLLNSDVVPDRPGWIGTMSAFYEATPKIGAVGPKLLYEDDSLQHAGLYFHRPAADEPWENAHCFKGLHRSFAAANVARAVPAVTAACMLVDRDVYEEVGGLPLHYVQGDYEDSELCLKLGEAGRDNWYLPSVELYHLEGQSYVPGERRIPSEYNMWLHTQLWGERIEELMAEFDPFAPVAQSSEKGPKR